jgi:hypothetical protein
MTAPDNQQLNSLLASVGSWRSSTIRALKAAEPYVADPKPQYTREALFLKEQQHTATTL